MAAPQSGPAIEYVREVQGESSLSYPKITGLDNQFVQDEINRKILALGEVEKYQLAMQAFLKSGGTGVTVKSEARFLTVKEKPRLFSVVFKTSGKQPDGKLGSRNIPMVFDLNNGTRLTAADLFTDAETAGQRLDEKAETIFSSDMMTYAEISSPLPVPLEDFSLEEGAIVFYYSAARYTTLSGAAGALHLYVGEVSLPFSELITSLDDYQAFIPGHGDKERIQANCSAGHLPGLLPKIGEAAESIQADYPQLIDPEVFPSGEKYYPEHEAFRGNALILNEQGRLGGILAQRMNLFGLMCGETEQKLVQACLGDPYSTIQLDENTALLYGMSEGTADEYRFGDHSLLMAYDLQGVLRTIFLSEITPESER